MICPLCGFEYDETALDCHAACPMAQGCAIVCCPNCGYQSVDESKSALAKLLRRLLKHEPPSASRSKNNEPS